VQIADAQLVPGYFDVTPSGTHSHDTLGLRASTFGRGSFLFIRAAEAASKTEILLICRKDEDDN
jgi:hypothetical protein